MSRTLSQEDYLGVEFGLLGVKPHIMHLRQDPGCAYSVITVAAPEYVLYREIHTAILDIFLEGAIKRLTGSALDALIVKRFAELGCGVAPCHAADNFSRKLGRIMSKGRLLKLIRKERCLSEEVHGAEQSSTDYRGSVERLGR